MTSPARETPAAFTDGDDLRVSVRAPQRPRVVPIRPDVTPGTAHARAIPDDPAESKSNPRNKVRNFTSQHMGEVGESLAASWLGTSRPRNLRDVARGLTAGSVGSRAAALFRLTVYAIAYLLCFAVDTNKRAAVVFTLLVLSLISAWAISVLAG